VVGGSLLGIVLGSAMALNSIVDRVIGPIFHAIRQVPTLAWIPLLGLWFGYGELPKLLIVTKAAMLPMVLGTYEGLRTVGTAEVEVGRVLTFDRWTMFRRVRLPAALPMMLTGLQQGLGFAWVACIGTEILFGSGLGIGALIEDGQIQGRMETVLLGVIFVGIIAALINTLFTRVAAHQLRWRDTRTHA
jgi:sulfonate transport system permease protein